MRTRTPARSAAITLLSVGGLLSFAGTSSAAFMHCNDINLYGQLDQKSLSMNGQMAEFGRWSCGPTALTNSLGYLQRKFDAHYTDAGGLRTLVPGYTNGMNPVADKAALLAVAELLAGPAYMQQQKGMAPAQPTDPYRRSPGPSQNDGTTPANHNSGGVYWERFAIGKDFWFNQQPRPSVLRGQLKPAWTVRPNDPPKPGWLEDGVAINPEKMFTDLRKGADVELGFSWIGAAGGHFVTVYGYELTLDVNNNNMWEPGDLAVLKIIDPWGDSQAMAGMASLTELLLDIDAMGMPRVSYTEYRGAAEVDVPIGQPLPALPSGSVQMWASEIPAPGSAGVLVLAGVVVARRRRR
jgi:uncharacterized protein (TIGR03382 family)